MDKRFIALALLLALLTGCSQAPANEGQEQKGEKPIPLPVNTQVGLRVDSNIVIEQDPTALQSGTQFDAVVQNDGKFQGKPVMLLLQNCKDASGSLQGGIGLKADEHVIGSGETAYYRATLTAEQQVAPGDYACEIFASDADGNSEQAALRFSVQ